MASAMAFPSRTVNVDAIPFACPSPSSSASSAASALFGDRLPIRFLKNSPSVVSFTGLQSICLNRKSAADKDGTQLGFEPHLAPSSMFRPVQASAAIVTAQQLQEEELLARFDRNMAKGGASKPGGISFSGSDGGFQKLGLDGMDVVNPLSDSEGMEVANLGLRDELVKALLSRGIAKMFPIQQAVFNPAMEGRDIIGRAKTGTGKTLAYGIPIIQHLLHEDAEGSLASRRTSRSPRALVLAPTRELALQVEKEFLLTAPNLSIVCVYGGVPISSQQRKLARGIDVAVGTPGRIIDLIDRGSLDLKSVQFIVLDEADQMLAVGFEEDVEKILEELPPSHQSLLFSATLPTWVKKVAKKYLNRPLTIDLVGETDDKLAEGIKLYSVTVAGSAKRTVLNDIITVYGKGGKTIVFTQTKKDADDIALSLSRIHGCEALHGDIIQGQREKTLNAFRSGKFTVLVATDVAARGLDIPNVDLVIHFEIPNDPETFVHRSGRTGRAGKEGIAVLMQTPEQQRTVKMIERDTGCSFERVSPPSLHDVLSASSDQAEEALSKVHPDLKNMFLKTAERLIEEQGAEALAAAIAHLSGYTQPPPPRSLITHEQGLVTLRVIRTQGPPLVSARRVMGALGEIHPEAVDNIGKILIMDDLNVSGAVFDLPEDYAKQLISKINEMGPEKGLEVELCTKMPKVIDDGPPATDMYGRFSSRGGGRERGRKPYGGAGGRYGDERGDESRNERGSSRFSRGRTENSDARFERRRSFSEGPFSGACYICGESGHKASFCPSGRQSSSRF